MNVQRLILSFALLIGVSSPSLKAEALHEDEWSKSNASNLKLKSAYLGIVSIGIMSTLWMLPAEQSQWYDKPALTPDGLYKRWRTNVGRGPVWDGDMRFFNGYGHIHSGAIYTMMCLNEAYTEFACTIYANLVSLAWEFGPEAIVERPSYQDILMTGLIGARVGIQLHKLQHSIITNGGKLVGSKILGSVVNLMIDPLTPFFNALPGINLKSEAVSMPLLEFRYLTETRILPIYGYKVAFRF